MCSANLLDWLFMNSLKYGIPNVIAALYGSGNCARAAVWISSRLMRLSSSNNALTVTDPQCCLQKG